MTMNMYFAGVGGQGVLLAANVLGKAAVKAGLDSTVSEIHGMAQRGGVVTCTVRIGSPVSPLIVKGGSDFFLGFEPLEALRALDFISKKTTVLVNTQKIVPFTVALGQYSYPDLEDILERLSRYAARVYSFNALELAQKAGSPRAANVVMLGALSALDSTVPEKYILAELRERFSKRLYDINRKAFQLGRKAIR